MSKIKFEADKTYLTRDKTTAVRIHKIKRDGELFPIFGYVENLVPGISPHAVVRQLGTLKWRYDGSYMVGSESPLDLTFEEYDAEKAYKQDILNSSPSQTEEIF